MGQLISLDQYKNYKEKKQDHQYQTYISTLKRFLSAKEPKNKLIHIEMLNRSQFNVKDSLIQPLLSRYIQMDNEDTLFEDKLIYAMMEHTSKKYYIDNSELLDVGVKQTLRDVFGERVIYI